VVSYDVKGPLIFLINTRDIRGSLHALKSRATLYILQVSKEYIFNKKHIIFTYKAGYSRKNKEIYIYIYNILAYN
jgi:hypothetical protein